MEIFSNLCLVWVGGGKLYSRVKLNWPCLIYLLCLSHGTCYPFRGAKSSYSLAVYFTGLQRGEQLHLDCPLERSVSVGCNCLGLTWDRLGWGWERVESREWLSAITQADRKTERERESRRVTLLLLSCLLPPVQTSQTPTWHPNPCPGTVSTYRYHTAACHSTISFRRLFLKYQSPWSRVPSPLSVEMHFYKSLLSFNPSSLPPFVRIF